MTETQITIQVLLFGACREAAGTGELTCAIAAPATVRQAWAELAQTHPALAAYAPHALFAVNEEHVRAEHPLQHGDTLAVFPPVSGG
jgi:molybdopterin converting factor subunit 1